MIIIQSRLSPSPRVISTAFFAPSLPLQRPLRLYPLKWRECEGLTLRRIQLQGASIHGIYRGILYLSDMVTFKGEDTNIC